MNKVILIGLTLFAGVNFSRAQETKPSKTFIDYFLPTPIIGMLSNTAHFEK